MPRPGYGWNIPDKVFKTTKETFKKQIYNRPCIVINDVLYDILEGSTYDNVMIKESFKTKMSYYFIQKEREKYANSNK